MSLTWQAYDFLFMVRLVCAAFLSKSICARKRPQQLARTWPRHHVCTRGSYDSMFRHLDYFRELFTGKFGKPSTKCWEGISWGCADHSRTGGYHCGVLQAQVVSFNPQPLAMSARVCSEACPHSALTWLLYQQLPLHLIGQTFVKFGCL